MRTVSCPKCGTPARVVILNKARVRCVLDEHGDVGRVLSVSREKPAAVIAGYECSGGHTWPPSEKINSF